MRKLATMCKTRCEKQDISKSQPCQGTLQTTLQSVHKKPIARAPLSTNTVSSPCCPTLTKSAKPCFPSSPRAAIKRHFHRVRWLHPANLDRVVIVKIKDLRRKEPAPNEVGSMHQQVKEPAHEDEEVKWDHMEQGSVQPKIHSTWSPSMTLHSSSKR